MHHVHRVRSIPTYVGFTTAGWTCPPPPTVHPHIRGVYDWSKIARRISIGPSPHTWGLRPPPHLHDPGGRSIPTYVGFTKNLEVALMIISVHPHIRGVYTAAAVASNVLAGPSPHTWGLRKGAPVGRIAERSIPTYVGFTLK